MRAVARTGVLLPMMLLALTGCGATVVGENADGIWFREPFIGGWNMQDDATQHCATLGKSAVRVGTLAPRGGFGLPIVAFNCE